MTIVIYNLKSPNMNQVVSKSQLKPHLLKYLRMVEKNKKPLIVTHNKKPVVKIIPVTTSISKTLDSLKGSVKTYHNPVQPVGVKDWELNV